MLRSRTKYKTLPDDPINCVGFTKKEISRFKAAGSRNNDNAIFLFPFSLIDRVLYDEHFQTTTLAKISAWIVLINYFFPTATKEFLIGDTLRQANDLSQTKEQASIEVVKLKKAWAEFLCLPIDKLGSEKTSIETNYLVPHSFNSMNKQPKSEKIRLSSWEKYALADHSEVPTIMLKVHKTFETMKSTLTHEDLLIETLTDDNLLFGQANLGFISHAFEKILCDLLGYTEHHRIAFKENKGFKDFLHGFALTAIHHIKKIHNIQLEETPHEKFSIQGIDTNITKKRNVLKNAQAKNLVNDFIGSFCYTLEETLVILDLLVRQARLKEVADSTPIWMLYPSGITDTPHFHPVEQLNNFFARANLPRRFLTGAGFQLPPEIEYHKTEYNEPFSSSSNGGNQTMYNSTTLAKDIAKLPNGVKATSDAANISPTATPNNSLPSTKATANNSTEAERSDIDCGSSSSKVSESSSEEGPKIQFAMDDHKPVVNTATQSKDAAILANKQVEEQAPPSPTLSQNFLILKDRAIKRSLTNPEQFDRLFDWINQAEVVATSVKNPLTHARNMAVVKTNLNNTSQQDTADRDQHKSQLTQ